MIYLKPILLKNNPKYNEKWVQDVIAKDPKILGLGDIELKDIERRQPFAGRLDLLLQNDENKRYEVEIQLGATDESHLIRTIEYWDIESKRYPQYKHAAVIIAEDVTTRFLNVIQLFNGFIPIIALKMTAYEVSGDIALTFTKILNERSLGMVDEDEETNVSVDKNVWNGYGTAIGIAEKIVDIIKSCQIDASLTYKRHFLGLMTNGRATNFVWFKPRKDHCVVGFKIEKNEETDRTIEGLGLDTLDYEIGNSSYRIKIGMDDIDRNKATIVDLIQASYKFYNS